MNNREYRERDYPPNPYNREEYQPLPLTHYDQYHGFRGNISIHLEMPIWTTTIFVIAESAMTITLLYHITTYVVI